MEQKPIFSLSFKWKNIHARKYLLVYNCSPLIVCGTNFRATLIFPAFSFRFDGSCPNLSAGTWRMQFRSVRCNHCCNSPMKTVAVTLAFNAYSFISVLSKSHSEKSKSTSPRKLFRPKRSLCHTETFKFCSFNSSRLILNYEKQQQSQVWRTKLSNSSIVT